MRSSTANVSDVASRLLDEVDVVVDAVHCAVMTLPGYGIGRRPGEIPDIREGTRTCAEVLVSSLTSGFPPPQDALDQSARVGTQRARQRLPRDSVAASLDLVVEALFGHTLTLVETDQHGVCSEVWQQLCTAKRHLRSALLSGYDAAQGQAGSLKDLDARAFLERVLAHRWESEAHVRSHAAAVGFPLRRLPGLVLVARLEGNPEPAATALAEAVGNAIEGDPRWTPIPHVPVLVGTSSTAWATIRNVMDKLATSQACFVCIPPQRSIDALVARFRFAEPGLIHVGATRRPHGTVEASELVVLHLLAGGASDHERRAYVDDVLGPLFASGEAGKLLPVMEALDDSSAGSVADVAKRLGIARNTARKRLDNIARVTLRSPHDSRQRYELITALRLHHVLSQRPHVGLAGRPEQYFGEDDSSAQKAR